MNEIDRKLGPLGVVWMAWSAVLVVVGLGVFLFASGVGGLIVSLPDSTTGEPAPWWAGALFGGLGLFIGGLFVLMGGFGVAMGQALRNGRRWAKFAALILAFLNLSNMPVGTALAVWTFVVVIPSLDTR